MLDCITGWKIINHPKKTKNKKSRHSFWTLSPLDREGCLNQPRYGSNTPYLLWLLYIYKTEGVRYYLELYKEASSSQDFYWCYDIRLPFGVYGDIKPSRQCAYFRIWMITNTGSILWFALCWLNVTCFTLKYKIKK